MKNEPAPTARPAFRSFDLAETSPCGDTNPGNARFTINGKRASRAEFDAIKRAPGAELSCMSNAQSGGVRTFYTVARIPPSLPSL